MVQVTNVGSADDHYNLSVSGLPSDVYAYFSQNDSYDVDVPPGAGNFRDFGLTLSAPLAPPHRGFTRSRSPRSRPATAASAPTASGTLTVTSLGVSVTLDKTSGSPGDTFTMTVTNTGSVADTYDLALAGPAALAAKLAQSTITLAPGASKDVAITTSAVNFAFPGNLALMATATSRTNPAIRAETTANLTIGTTHGLSAQLSPASQTLPKPGTASFLLTVDNTGNTADTYTATITGTHGPVVADLVGLDGQPTQGDLPFQLPGLSSGAILIRGRPGVARSRGR